LRSWGELWWARTPVCCMAFRSWHAAIKQCAFFLVLDCPSVLRYNVYSPSCTMVCSAFLLDLHLRYFFILCFSCTSTPPQIKLKLEMFHSSLSLFVALFSLQTKSSHNSMLVMFKYIQNLCIVTTPWPRAFNIYTSLKLPQSNFPLCFISEGFGLSDLWGSN
jgi:hypothetical protein